MEVSRMAGMQKLVGVLQALVANFLQCVWFRVALLQQDLYIARMHKQTRRAAESGSEDLVCRHRRLAGMASPAPT